LVLLVGPTAAGKTELAISLAELLGGEIVSADSRLFYLGMDIGTAKPSAQQLARVPHHLINISTPDRLISLPEFRERADAAIAEIGRRGRLPIMVGGTGQYISAVVEGWEPPRMEPNIRLRTVLERLGSERGFLWLHRGLSHLDPAAAARIDPNNLRRTVRALEVTLLTGRRFSEQRSRAAPKYRLIGLGLLWPRPELYARIDARIEQMFAMGLLEETRRLVESGYSPRLPTMSAIGYPECVGVLSGQWTLEQAKAMMRKATRAFVRRQSNWFRRSSAELNWFRMEEDLPARLADHVRHVLSSAPN